MWEEYDTWLVPSGHGQVQSQEAGRRTKSLSESNDVEQATYSSTVRQWLLKKGLEGPVVEVAESERDVHVSTPPLRSTKRPIRLHAPRRQHTAGGNPLGGGAPAAAVGLVRDPSV